MMADPKSRKSLADALKEPGGSGKRKSAHSTLKIYGRLAGKADGQGGSEDFTSAFVDSLNSRVTGPRSTPVQGQSSNAVEAITPMSDTPTITRQAQGFDWQGLLKPDYFEYNETDPNIKSLGKAVSNVGTFVVKPLAAVGRGIPVAGDWLVSAPYRAAVGLGRWMATVPKVEQSVTSEKQEAATTSTPGTASATGSQETAGTGTGTGTGTDTETKKEYEKPYEEWTDDEKQTDAQSKFDERKTGLTETGQILKLAEQIRAETGKTPNTGYPDVDLALSLTSSIGSAVTSGNVDEWWAGITANGNTPSKTQEILYKSVKQGTGESGFRASFLSNPDAMAEVLGIEASVLRKFPIFAMGTPDYGALRKIVEREYQVDASYDEIMNLDSRHRLASNAFKSYVVDKDLYLKDIEKKKAELRQFYANNDMSDPFVRQQYETYGGWLDTAYSNKIADYNVLLTNASEYETEDYNRSLARLNIQLQRAENQFTAVSKTVDDFWTGAKDALDAAYVSAQTGMNASDKTRKSLLDILEQNQKIKNLFPGYEVDTKTKVTAFDTENAMKDFMTVVDVKDNEGNDIKKQQPLVTTYGQMENLLATKRYSATADNDQFRKLWANVMGQYIADDIRLGDFSGAKSTYAAMISDIPGDADMLMQKYATDENSLTAEERRSWAKIEMVNSEVASSVQAAASGDLSSRLNDYADKVKEAFSSKAMPLDDNEWERKFLSEIKDQFAISMLKILRPSYADEYEKTVLSSDDVEGEMKKWNSSDFYKQVVNDPNLVDAYISF